MHLTALRATGDREAVSQLDRVQEHLYLLDLAARGALPERVDNSSELSFVVVRELVEAGYLSAIDASSLDGYAYLNPRITLSGREYLARLQKDQPSPHEELLRTLERMRDIMVAVSTGGPRIGNVNHEYRELFEAADTMLARLGIANPIPFPDLWDWYGCWSGGDLPSYQSRREFLAAQFGPLLAQVRDRAAGRTTRWVEPTGWPKVDRAVGEARSRLAAATTEEQFQAVGLLCREVLISLAQAVHDPERHRPLDGTTPSDTDAKRKLDAYIAIELAGASNEIARRHARASYDLAVELQHRRTATFRQAALCVEATASAVNVIAILSGRRDPSV